MAGQFEKYFENGGTTGLTTDYWTLTPLDASYVCDVNIYGYGSNFASTHVDGVRPSLNLKSNVKITSGTGTKTDPFILSI